MVRRGFSEEYGQRLAVQQRLALGGGQQAQHQFGDGGLAAAGLADETDGLAGGHVQVDVVQDARRGAAREQAGAAILEAQAIQADAGGCRAAVPALHTRRQWLRAARFGHRATLAECASPDGRVQRWHGAGDGGQVGPGGGAAWLGNAVQQHGRVGVAGALQHVAHAAAFDDVARVHDDDVVRDARDQPHIVGNEHHAQPEFRLDVTQQVQQFGLYRHVQRGGRFVGDQQFGAAHQRHGDHHALAQAARQFERVLLHAVLRVRDADPAQQVFGAFDGLPAADGLVTAQHVDQLRADREHRVQRRHGILEDHGDARAA
ncbi:hypothetical protein G6F35_011769 [Rhizopus arrhizus]|nr:hypothetical protein G6F35_011769 [Rhizopus arrhizus]